MFRRESVDERLKELDIIRRELSRYGDITLDSLRSDLSERWIIERGLIAGASVIFDIADHILSEEFGVYPESYEESLKGLFDNEVISEELYLLIKGLGGFRNVLIHRYTGIEPDLVFENFLKALTVFSRFAKEIINWLDST
ncbi:MAG TPA: DUF86 domain-containing protein [Methanothrix sp.]|nr:DUF86 domain-containing protein [Methanothrix sp.]